MMECHIMNTCDYSKMDLMDDIFENSRSLQYLQDRQLRRKKIVYLLQPDQL